MNCVVCVSNEIKLDPHIKQIRFCIISRIYIIPLDLNTSSIIGLLTLSRQESTDGLADANGCASVLVFLQAIRSFQIALHIYPLNSELWNEDLSWAKKLQQQKKATKTETGTQGAENETLEEPIPDYDFESDEILAVCAAIAEKEKNTSASKTVVIVSASGTVETVTEQEESATLPDGAVFIKAR